MLPPKARDKSRVGGARRNLDLEALEPRLLLSVTALVAPPPTPVQQWQNPNGNALVSVYDVAGPLDVNPADIKVVFGKNNSVTSITLGGTQPMEGLGIVISGASSVGSIKDARKSPGVVAFIASDAPITSLSLKSGTSGYDLNGLTLGGLVLPDDIDGDGSTTDATALYCTRALSTVTLAGAVSGDCWIGGIDAKGLSIKSFATKNGGFDGDLVTSGPVGAITLGGDFGSGMDIGGALASLTIKGGNFSGALMTQGAVGKISISAQKDKVTGMNVGGAITNGTTIIVNGADAKKNLSLNALSATGAISGLDMALTGGLSSLSCAGWSGGSLFAGAVGKVTLAGDFNSQMTVDGPLVSLTIKGGDFSGALTAQGPVGKISISGDLANAQVNLTGQDAKGYSLGSANIVGKIDNSNIILTHSGKSFTVGYWGAGSVLAVAVDPGTDGYFSGDESSTVGHLDSLTVRNGYATANGGVGFGVIADEFRTIKAFLGPLPYNNGDFHAWLV